MTSAVLNNDLREKFTNTSVTIFAEFSNALFSFSLPCLGAELAGRGSSTPSPSISWKIQKANRARANFMERY